MSSPAPAKARKIAEYDRAPVSQKERRALNRLGWKDVDISELTVREAKANIASKSAKPGSKAAMRAVEKEIGVPNPALHFSDEEIEKRNAQLPESSGVKILSDEFTRKCVQAGTEDFVMDEYTGKVVQGADPLNAVLIEMQAKYPDRRFRWMHEKEPLVAGPSWDPVYQDGKVVRDGELYLAWMPLSAYEEGHRKPVQQRSQMITGRLESNKSDEMKSTGDGPIDNLSEGILQTGWSNVNAAQAA